MTMVSHLWSVMCKATEGTVHHTVICDALFLFYLSFCLFISRIVAVEYVKNEF